MATVSVVVLDKLAVTTAEQRLVDLVTAKGDTPRLHTVSDGGVNIAASTAMIIITGDASESGTAVVNFAGPVMLLNTNRVAAMLLGSGPASPPTSATWSPSSGAIGSPYLAGISAPTDVWSSAQAHRHVTTPAPGAQRLFDLNSNTARLVAYVVPEGGQRTDGTPAPGPRYVGSFIGTAMAGGYSSTTGAVLSAAYSQLLSSGGVVDPLSVTIVDSTTAGGDRYTLSASVSGGVAPYTYAWTPPGAALSTKGLTTATPSAVMPATGGSHSWSLTVTDQVSATGSDTGVVNGTPRQLYGLEASTLPVGWTTSTGSTNPTTVLDDVTDGPGLTPGDFVTIPGGTQTITIGVDVPSTAASSGWDFYLDLRLPATVGSGSVTVELLDGATVRGTETPTLTLTTTEVQRLKASFTAPECAAITNPANAAVRITTVLPA